MKKWIMALVGLPVAAAAVVYGVGAMLPPNHVAARSALIRAAPVRVAALVRDVEGQPRWRSGVTAIEIVERGPERLQYRERSSEGDILFDFSEEAVDTRFRSVIADPSLPFGGSWTIGLKPAPGGTRIVIEEIGMVRDPLYRFFSALVFGHTATMDAYLSDLKHAAESR